MKIFRYSLLIVCALLISTGCQGSHKYDVEMSEKGLKIGDRIFTMPLSLSELEDEIGKPNRKQETPFSDIYFWDTMGVEAHYDKRSEVGGRGRTTGFSRASTSYACQNG